MDGLVDIDGDTLGDTLIDGDGLTEAEEDTLADGETDGVVDMEFAITSAEGNHAIAI